MSQNAVDERKKCKNKSKPWYDTDLKTLKRDMILLSKQVVKDFKSKFLRSKLFKLKKLYKRTTIRKKNCYKQNILNNLEDLEDTNPKEYWALFNKLKSDKCSGKNKNNVPEKEWLNHYSNLLGPKIALKPREPNIEKMIQKLKSEPFFSDLDFSITCDEVLLAVKSLKKNKAVGIDCVSNEMIVSSTDTMLKVYQKLFNAILNLTHYPHMWKRGIVVNLYKAGDPFDTENYRGLTINSCLAKVFNTIINNRIDKFLHENCKINKAQIGFKKKARTSDHIFVLNTLLQKYNKRGKKIYACFIDFKKAFDSVWRKALMWKILKMGIRGNLFKLLEDMYDGGHSCIKIDDELSDIFKCETGVRQGDVLSPNLFNIFINDLPECLITNQFTPVLGKHTVNCLMYADDLVALSLSIDALQLQLNNINEYCKEWGLDVNAAKTKVMVMAKYGHKKPNRNVTIGNQTLEWVSYYKYLGIELQKNCNMMESTKNLCTRSWKAIFMINSSLKHISVKAKTRLLLFDRLVSPVLCYNSEVWGNILHLPKNKVDENYFWKRAETLPPENLQLRYLKIILGVHSKATNAAVRGEVGRYPLAIKIVQSMLRFWKHIDDVSYDNPLLKEARAECDNVLDTPGSWLTTIKQMFTLFHVRWTGVQPNDNDAKGLLNKMRQSYVRYWKSNIGNVNERDGKLCTYRKIKGSFRKESYLDLIRDTNHRKAMTTFRTSAHRLEIETYRYSKVHVPRNERLCSLCTPDYLIHIGDEFHALMICKRFKQGRDELLKLFTENYIQFGSMNLWDKFFYILTYEGSLINQVGKFIYEILSVKRDYTYVTHFNR